MAPSQIFRWVITNFLWYHKNWHHKYFVPSQIICEKVTITKILWHHKYFVLLKLSTLKLVGVKIFILHCNCMQQNEMKGTHEMKSKINRIVYSNLCVVQTNNFENEISCWKISFILSNYWLHPKNIRGFVLRASTNAPTCIWNENEWTL